MHFTEFRVVFGPWVFSSLNENYSITDNTDIIKNSILL